MVPASWEASCVEVEVNSRGKIPNGSLAVRGTTMVLEKKPVAYSLENSDSGVDWLREQEATIVLFKKIPKKTGRAKKKYNFFFFFKSKTKLK